jgi:broad specificity phosphatase PhoE
MHLYLIRHGQSYINLPNWDEDSWDEPLTPLGLQQAEVVANWIADHITAGHLYSSTLLRARQTAAAISRRTGLEIQFDIRLREVGANRPDGTPFSGEQLSRYIEGVWGTLQPYDPITENGESWMQFRTRVGAFIESLIRSLGNHIPMTPEELERQNVLIVCHGGVIEAFYEYVFEKGPWSVVSVLTGNTGITHLEYRPVPNRPAWRLHYHNQLGHLTPELIS